MHRIFNTDWLGVRPVKKDPSGFRVFLYLSIRRSTAFLSPLSASPGFSVILREGYSAPYPSTVPSPSVEMLSLRCAVANIATSPSFSGEETGIFPGVQKEANSLDCFFFFGSYDLFRTGAGQGGTRPFYIIIAHGIWEIIKGKGH